MPDATAVKTIPAKIYGTGTYAEVLVDEDDYEYLSQFAWGLIGAGYPARQVYTHSVKKPGKKRSQSYYRKIYMHREILQPDDDQFVDHINRNKLDNRRTNLRACSPAQNAYNKASQLTKNGEPTASTFKGVRRAHAATRMKSKTWLAEIGADGHTKSLGYFASEAEAATAYNAAALEMHGEFAYLNHIA